MVATGGGTGVGKTRAGDDEAGGRNTVIVGHNEAQAGETVSRLGKPARREGSPLTSMVVPGPEK
jgi:hypothetical protein